jgi:hypothetical protein
MSNEVAADTVRTWREQGLTAAVHLACPRCRAPGVFSSEDRILMDWPGCHVPPEDERSGQPVGDRCPNCLAARGPNLLKRLGEIWRNRFT